jgi:hypothetical protein
MAATDEAGGLSRQVAGGTGGSGHRDQEATT